jgi:membrane-bound ClpP family serine protease
LKRKSGKTRWSKRAVIKYVLLQIPGAALLLAVLVYFRERMGLAWWVVVLITALWIVKDIVLFPFVWRAYEFGKKENDPLIGAIGIAEEPLQPSGYVKVRGELWRARLTDSSSSVEEGGPVRVAGREGLTLSVEKSD